MRSSYKIQSLELTNFKLYKTSKINFSDGLIVITGKNGVGKTSILDAVRMLVFGKSYFSGNDKSCIAHDSNFMRASTQIIDSRGFLHQLVVKLQEGKGKVLEQDGKKVLKLSDYVGQFLSVCVSPDDILLVNGQSSDRRNFIDQAIVQLDKEYTHHLIQYTKAVKQRNALLKLFLKKGKYDESLVAAFDSIMIKSAPFIHAARENFIREFSAFFNSNYREIAPIKEVVALTYQSKLSQNTMEDLLTRYREKDKFSGRTNAGVHKDELIMLLQEKELKLYGSQGQIKSYVFALKIALFEFFVKKTNRLPILLLDDMFDKLDHSRVEKILEHLNEKWGSQVFITDTDKDRIPRFLNEKGKINQHIHILEDQEITYPDV